MSTLINSEQTLLLFDIIGQICGSDKFKKLVNKYYIEPKVSTQTKIEHYLNKAILQSINALGPNYENKFNFNLCVQIKGIYNILVYWKPNTTVGIYYFDFDAENEVLNVDGLSFAGTAFYTAQQNIDVNKNSGYNSQLFRLGSLPPNIFSTVDITAYRFTNNEHYDIYVYLYVPFRLYNFQ